MIKNGFRLRQESNLGDFMKFSYEMQFTLQKQTQETRSV